MRENGLGIGAAAVFLLLAASWFADHAFDSGLLKWLFLGLALVVAFPVFLALLGQLGAFLRRALGVAADVARSGGFSMLREPGAAARPGPEPTTKAGKLRVVLASGGFSLLRDPRPTDRRPLSGHDA